MKRHLAVDLDDVVLDFCGGLRAAVKKEFGVEIAEDEISQFDLHPLLDPIVGRSWWAWLRERDWLWANFPAVDGAMGSLERLRRQGNYLELVTMKPEWAEHSVYKWLGKWRPPFNRVTIIGMEQTKEECTDAEMLIDDKFENCARFIDVGRQAIMFGRPHNLHIRPLMLKRAEGWSEVMDLLQ